MNATLLKATIATAMMLVANIGCSEDVKGMSGSTDAKKQQSVKKDVKDEPTTQISIKELAELGPGVYKVKKGENNVFKSCVVVGQARISTVLGAGKGLATARRNAKSKAESEFVSWLKTNTSSVRSFGDEVEFMLKGDGKDMAETGTSTETSIETITSSAQGAIRGLSLIGSSQDAQADGSMMLTQVYAWKPDFANVADQIEAAMKPSQKPLTAEASKKTDEQPKTPSSPMKAKTTIAPEAGEFL